MEYTDDEILNEVGYSTPLSTDGELDYAQECLVLAKQLPKLGEDTLYGAWLHGPLTDGDVPSKLQRDWCVSCGLMTRVVVRGEDGFNACTMRGQLVLQMALKLRGKTLSLKYPQ